MGRLDVDPILQHFSHSHPLKLVNLNPEITNGSLASSCAACKLPATGWMYKCKSCNYYLHKACSQMPRGKKHQVDPDHTFTLLPLPAYPQGSFKCNACGDHGTGFSYHCKDCELDLHTLCAHMPSSANIILHNHTLHLFFSPPYHKKAFKCDICKGSGSNHWLYRCNSCNFDAHLNCAIANIIQEKHQTVKSLSTAPQLSASKTIHRFASSPAIINQIPAVGSSSSRSYPAEQVGGGGRYHPWPPGVPVVVSPNYPYVQPQKANQFTDNNLTTILVKGVLDGVAQQAGQILLGSLLGGFPLN